MDLDHRSWCATSQQECGLGTTCPCDEKRKAETPSVVYPTWQTVTREQFEELVARAEAAEREREADYQRFVETSQAVMDRAEKAERSVGRLEEALRADLLPSVERMLRHGHDFWEARQHSPESDEMSAALTELHFASIRARAALVGVEPRPSDTMNRQQKGDYA